MAHSGGGCDARCDEASGTKQGRRSDRCPGRNESRPGRWYHYGSVCGPASSIATSRVSGRGSGGGGGGRARLTRGARGTAGRVVTWRRPRPVGRDGVAVALRAGSRSPRACGACGSHARAGRGCGRGAADRSLVGAAPRSSGERARARVHGWGGGGSWRASRARGAAGGGAGAPGCGVICARKGCHLCPCTLAHIRVHVQYIPCISSTFSSLLTHVHSLGEHILPHALCTCACIHDNVHSMHFTEHIWKHSRAFGRITFFYISVQYIPAPTTFYDGPPPSTSERIRVHRVFDRNVVGANVIGMYEKRVGR